MSLTKSQINVLHIIHNLKLEGAQKVLVNLVCEQKKYSCEPFVVAYKKKGELFEVLKKSLVKTVYIAEGLVFHGRYRNISSYLHIIIRIIRIIKTKNIGLIHAHMSDGAILGWGLTFFTKLPMVITFHSTNLHPFRIDKNPLKKRIRHILLAYAVKKAAGIIAVSEGVKIMLEHNFKNSGAKTKTIVNGIQINPDSETNRANIINMSRPVIISVGRHVAIKGFDQLIRAASKVLSSYPSASFCIIGEGCETAKLKQKVRDLKLHDHFVWPGVQENINAWLARADVYVNTSHYEGAPMSVLEAMNAGVPLVLSNVPGNRDLIEDGVNGILYPRDDINKLAESICYILKNGNKADKYVANAKKMVTDKFSIDKIAFSTIELYKEILM